VSRRQLSGSKACIYRWYARVARNIYGMVLWKYRIHVDWCWNGARITEVELRAEPEIVWPCCWYWGGQVVWDVSGTSNDQGPNTAYFRNWGESSITVYTKGRFEYRFPIEGGFGGDSLPWIRFTAYAGGNYSRTGGG
jgi:hypothetical protein